MQNLENWLESMALQPLPGAVSAAAVAGAMGAALVAKTIRVTLARQALSAVDRATLEETFQVARAQQGELMSLAQADEQAYRAVIETRRLPGQDPAWRQARQAATEVPIRIAEACSSLLEGLSDLLDVCWPAVRPDLKAGRWLLQAGTRTGLLAAQVNLRAWGEGAGLGAVRARMAALSEERLD